MSTAGQTGKVRSRDGNRLDGLDFDVGEGRRGGISGMSIGDTRRNPGSQARRRRYWRVGVRAAVGRTVGGGKTWGEGGKRDVSAGGVWLKGKRGKGRRRGG
eukprot:828768-Rhodomonas_salina.2